MAPITRCDIHLPSQSKEHRRYIKLLKASKISEAGTEERKLFPPSKDLAKRVHKRISRARTPPPRKPKRIPSKETFESTPKKVPVDGDIRVDVTEASDISEKLKEKPQEEQQKADKVRQYCSVDATNVCREWCKSDDEFVHRIQQIKNVHFEDIGKDELTGSEAESEKGSASPVEDIGIDELTGSEAESEKGSASPVEDIGKDELTGSEEESEKGSVSPVKDIGKGEEHTFVEKLTKSDEELKKCLEELKERKEALQKSKEELEKQTESLAPRGIGKDKYVTDYELSPYENTKKRRRELEKKYERARLQKLTEKQYARCRRRALKNRIPSSIPNFNIRTNKAYFLRTSYNRNYPVMPAHIKKHLRLYYRPPFRRFRHINICFKRFDEFESMRIVNN